MASALISSAQKGHFSSNSFTSMIQTSTNTPLPTITQLPTYTYTPSPIPSDTPTVLPPGYITTLPFSTDFSDRAFVEQDSYRFIINPLLSKWWNGYLLLFTGTPRTFTPFKDPLGNYLYCMYPNCDAISFNPMSNEFDLSFLARTYKADFEGVNWFPPEGYFSGAWFLRFLGSPDTFYYLIVDDGFNRSDGFAVFYASGSELKTIIPWTGFGYYNYGVATDKPAMSAWRIKIENGMAMVYFNQELLSQFNVKDTGGTWISFGELSTLGAPTNVGTLIDDLNILH